MEICQVCDRELKSKVHDGIMCCANCRWPVGFATINADPISQFALRWAKSMYRQFAELKMTQATATPVIVPSIKLAQISSDSTLERLASRMLVVEENLHRFDGLSQGVQAAKEAIDHNKQLSKRVDAIEVWCRAAHEDILDLQQQPTSHRVTADRDSEPTIEAQPVAAIESSSDLLAAELLKSMLVLTPTEKELVILYNKFNDLPEELLNMAQDVSLEEGIIGLRNGDISRTLFVAKQQGIFLVVNKNGFWYLLPNKKRPITDIIYRTVKCIYNCSGYNEDYEQLVLLKPALMQETVDNKWQLSQTGALKFV
jgi:hypothetical protein